MTSTLGQLVGTSENRACLGTNGSITGSSAGNPVVRAVEEMPPIPLHGCKKETASFLSLNQPANTYHSTENPIVQYARNPLGNLVKRGQASRKYIKAVLETDGPNSVLCKCLAPVLCAILMFLKLNVSHLVGISCY